MRFHAQTAAIENGFVHLPKYAPWLDAYLHELLRFPRGHHDDQVDSTSQALAWLKRPSHTGMIEFYRLMNAERDGRSSASTIRLKAPEGVTTLYTADGQYHSPQWADHPARGRCPTAVCIWLGGMACSEFGPAARLTPVALYPEFALHSDGMEHLKHAAIPTAFRFGRGAVRVVVKMSFEKNISIG